jgi:hypothetical protein
LDQHLLLQRLEFTVKPPYVDTSLKWTSPHYGHLPVRPNNFCCKWTSRIWTPLYSGLWTLFFGPVHSEEPLQSGQSPGFKIFLALSKVKNKHLKHIWRPRKNCATNLNFIYTKNHGFSFETFFFRTAGLSSFSFSTLFLF